MNTCCRPATAQWLEGIYVRLVRARAAMAAGAVARRDRIVVSTLRCGRSNLGSNPSHGMASVFHVASDFFFFNTVMVCTGFCNMWPPILSEIKIIKVYSQNKMHKSWMNSYLMWNNHQNQEVQNFFISQVWKIHFDTWMKPSGTFPR